MYNNHPKFRDISLRQRLNCYGIISLVILSITITVLSALSIIPEKIVNPINCLSSLFSCCLLAKLLKLKSKKLFYILLGCSGICFVCFVIVIAITYLN